MIECFKFVVQFFLQEKNAFVFVNQHNRRNDKCKPAIGSLRYAKTIGQNCRKMSCKAMLLVSITHVQTRLTTNQVVAGCQKFLQKAENSFDFLQQIYTCCAFYRTKANLIRSKCKSRSWHDSRVILYNQKSVFKQLATTFICCKTGLNVRGKTRNVAFNTFCSNVAKQVQSINQSIIYFNTLRQRAKKLVQNTNVHDFVAVIP